MKKYRNLLISFIMVSMLISMSVISVNITKSDDYKYVPQPEIFIKKEVWNGSTWADYAEVDINDTVEFRVEIYNPNENDVRFSGYILDTFSANFEYNEGSVVVIDDSEYSYNPWDEFVDLEKNTVNWSTIPEIKPYDYLNFTFSAKAVGCGLGYNNVFVRSYTLVEPGEVVTLTGSDIVDVYVHCPDEYIIPVNKMIWNGSAWADYAEVKKDEIVNFRVEIYNPTIYELSFSGYILDTFPDNLRYINKSLIVLREDTEWIEGYDWNKNQVKWGGMLPILPGNYLNFTFNATPNDCGIGINNIFVLTHAEIEPHVVIDYTGSDNATVDIDCTPPEIPEISVEKKVKENCCGQYADDVTIDIDAWVRFKIIITNTGETELDITVKDILPLDLNYANSATPREADYIENNNYYWYFYNVLPKQEIVITFKSTACNYGKHENIANVTGISDCGQTVYDEDTAIVNVSCEEWDNSNIELTGECVCPNAVFTITNTANAGEGDMQGPSQYRVFRNGVLEDYEDFQLDGGESTVVTVLANCDEIRLVANQRPGHPGGTQVEKTIKDCGCEEPTDYEIGVDKGLKIRKISTYIENKDDIDINNIDVEINVSSLWSFKEIDLLISDNIELIKAGETKNLVMNKIKGFGPLEINIKTKIPKQAAITITEKGFIIGSFVIIL